LGRACVAAGRAPKNLAEKIAALGEKGSRDEAMLIQLDRP
jgi:hypothetical protein